MLDDVLIVRYIIRNKKIKILIFKRKIFDEVFNFYYIYITAAYLGNKIYMNAMSLTKF